jgi:hypothetical protein
LVKLGKNEKTKEVIGLVIEPWLLEKFNRTGFGPGFPALQDPPETQDDSFYREDEETTVNQGTIGAETEETGPIAIGANQQPGDRPSLLHKTAPSPDKPNPEVASINSPGLSVLGSGSIRGCGGAQTRCKLQRHNSAAEQDINEHMGGSPLMAALPNEGGLPGLVVPGKPVSSTTSGSQALIQQSAPISSRVISPINCPQTGHAPKSRPISPPELPVDGTASGDMSACHLATEVHNNTAIYPRKAAPAAGPPPAKAPPRISNPATRGRKAALKSDAAGHAPQPVLPVDMMNPENRPPPRCNSNISQLTRLVLADQTNRDRTPPPERPKRKMAFPGFAPVSEGGPWSKEAYDLLGTGKPT